MFTPKALNTSRSRVGAGGRVGSIKSNKNDSFGTPVYRDSPMMSGTGTPSRGMMGTPSRGVTGGNTSMLSQSVTTGMISTSMHQLDSYGGLIPVAVTELISTLNKNSTPSVKLWDHGWASLVAGKKLLIWKFKVSGYGKTPQCVELTLPPSSRLSLATTSLVTLLPSDRGEEVAPACLAVSPEGVVRYWVSTAHPGSYAEVAMDIKDEHFVSVVPVEQRVGPTHFVAAGNNSTLYLIINTVGQLKWRLFQKPHGMLKGISRRMSSFIFGGMPTAADLAGANMQALISGEIMEEAGECAIYMLTGANLQKWCILGETEKMLYQQNVEKLMGDSVGQGVWQQNSADLPNLKVWLLDIQVVGDAVIVLGAAHNPDVSNQVYYAVGTLHTEGVDPPQSFLSFSIPQFTNQITDIDNWLGMRCLLPDSNKWNVYLYDNTSVVCTCVTESQQPIDKVDFTSPGDKLLGGGICNKSALFFSNVHGVVTIKDISQPSAAADESRSGENQSMLPEQSYMENMDELSCSVSESKMLEMSMSDDSLQRLKAAFLHYARGNITQAQALVGELFPGGGGSGQLDSLVLQLSCEMVDDIPARDPRWADKAAMENNTSLSSGSLILIHQLDDKLKAHEYFTKFLKIVELWDRLTSMPVNDTPQLTRLLLCEHAEKIAAAKSLREMHIQHEEIVNAAIEKLMLTRGGSDMMLMNVGGLTAHDLYYRKVSKMEDIFEHLVACEQERLSHNATQDVYNLISAVNNTLYNAMFAAYQYRITKSVMYESTQHPGPAPDFIPWTATPGAQGVRNIMKQQYNISINQGISEARDAQEKENLFQQIMEMADMILDGCKIQLEAMKRNINCAELEQQHSDAVKMYQSQRSELLAPFLRHDQYERAASLAEKYCDFGILVQICEQTGNEERLQRYMEQFQSKGFPDFVFRWHIEEGKRGKLMASNLVSHPQLSNFLQTGDNKFMSWLNDVNSNDFHRAHYTLMDLAQTEETYLGKKKTLLSLGKLAALAASDGENTLTDNIRDCNIKQDMLLHQEQLPKTILDNLGINEVDMMRVLTPAKLVELYISDYNSNANEFDFKKALDLLQYVKDEKENQITCNEDPDSLILQIWCRAILRDNWALINTHDLLEDIKDTVFFKTVEMAHADEEISLQRYLPNVDVLLGCELLGSLRADKKFEYLIRAGFEQIHRLL